LLIHGGGEEAACRLVGLPDLLQKKAKRVKMLDGERQMSLLLSRWATAKATADG
jgi:hypothetical protein